MAKGAASKTAITNKLLEIFDGSFVYNEGKEIRIPMIENGETVQIKVTLTAAKVAVEAGADTAIPGTTPEVNAEGAVKEITSDEKNEVNDLISALGL